MSGSDNQLVIRSPHAQTRLESTEQRMRQIALGGSCNDDLLPQLRCDQRPWRTFL